MSETLAQFLKLQAELLDMSSRKIAETATRAGFRVSHTTVADYLAGRRTNPDEHTIRALAAALRVEPVTLRELAGKPVDRGAYTPPETARAMTLEQRRIVDALIREFASLNKTDD